jgi:multidrug efflux pump subunit AcrA (membrane-fusion protein)
VEELEMPQLSVNLDLVAALRGVRGLVDPDPTRAAVLAELAMADGIAVQLRRDRMGIRERDLYLLKGVTKTKLILEMPPVEDIVEKALEVKPWMVTLVADHTDVNSPVSTIDLAAAPADYADLAVDDSTGTFLIRATVPNPDRIIPPGAFIRVQLPLEEVEALLIDETAIGRDQAGAYLLIVNKENKVERRTISLGEIYHGMRAITGPISPEDQVIVKGLQRARLDAEVDPQMEAAAPEPKTESEPEPSPTNETE